MSSRFSIARTFWLKGVQRILKRKMNEFSKVYVLVLYWLWENIRCLSCFETGKFTYGLQGNIDKEHSSVSCACLTMRFPGYPRCNIIYLISLFYRLLLGLGLLLRMFCFLSFTSAVRNKLYYTGDEPDFRVVLNLIMKARPNAKS